MGVDARILIKITEQKSWLNPAQLRRTSSQLTNVIGPEYFFLRPEEDRHALSFVLEETRKWAEKYPDEYPEFNPNIAIWSQDGDDIVAEPNEQFIEVHVGGRYYGENYARGDWKSLSWIMMWCMFNIQDCEIWYGGDSSGICVEHMTSERMNQMTKYYLTAGNDQYWMNSKTKYPCEFCGTGTTCSGGGNGIGYWHCDSCGSQWVTHDPNGKVPRSFRDETPGQLITKYDKYGTDREFRSDSMATFAISDQIRTNQRKLYQFDGTFRQKYPYVQTEMPKELAANNTLQLESGT
jgi:hypothetical protein